MIQGDSLAHSDQSATRLSWAPRREPIGALRTKIILLAHLKTEKKGSREKLCKNFLNILPFRTSFSGTETSGIKATLSSFRMVFNPDFLVKPGPSTTRRWHELLTTQNTSFSGTEKGGSPVRNRKFSSSFKRVA